MASPGVKSRPLQVNERTRRHQLSLAVGLNHGRVPGHGHAAHGYRRARALVASIGAPGALALNGVVVLVAAALLVIAAPAYRRPLARGADPS